MSKPKKISEVNEESLNGSHDPLRGFMRRIHVWLKMILESLKGFKVLKACQRSLNLCLESLKGFQVSLNRIMPSLKK